MARIGAGQIAVVHHPNDSALFAELDRLNLPSEDRIENPQPELGMFSSIVCAANWTGWRNEISSWAIALGDQPHLQTGTLRTLLEFAAQNPDAICQPQFGGTRRHPVILPRTAIEALKQTRAGNLRDFLKQTSLPSVKCPMTDPGWRLTWTRRRITTGCRVPLESSFRKSVPPFLSTNSVKTSLARPAPLW